MKKFFRQFFFFILPLIPLALILDFYISENLRSGYSSGGEFEVWNDIYKGEMDAQIAIYGSSRALVHLDPEIFKKKLCQEVYNFGVDGHNFKLQYLRHQEYFRYNKLPTVIILSIDEHSLSKGNPLYNKDQLLPYLLWKINIFSSPPIEGYNVVERSLPLWRYNGKRDLINNSLGIDREEKFRNSGFRAMDLEWNTDLEKAMAANPNYRIEMDTVVVEQLKKFVNEVKKEGIQLIFVNTPTYIKGQEFIRNRKEFQSLIYELALENHIPYFDYSSHSISSNKSFFYNSMHLNEEGAQKFTKIFVNDLMEQELIK